MVYRSHDRFPAFKFDLPPGPRAAIVVSGHLGKDAVAQTKRRIAEALEPKLVQEFLVDDCARYDDLRSSGPNAFDLSPFRNRQSRQAFRDALHFGRGHHEPLPAAGAST